MKTIIFSRVSSMTDRQTNERQILDLKDYAEALSYEVVSIFEEKISGGKKNSERDVLTNAIAFCIANGVEMILTSELSRIGRDVLEIQSAIKILIDNKINLYCDKEKFTLLDDDKKCTPFAPLLITVLGTCAQLERESIKYRLESGLKRYREKGGRMGRNKGTTMTKEQMKEKYNHVIKNLKLGISVRKTAKLCDCGISTVQRVKTMFEL